MTHSEVAFVFTRVRACMYIIRTRIKETPC